MEIGGEIFKNLLLGAPLIFSAEEYVLKQIKCAIS